MERRVIVIAGPTCSGKTRLGINIAKRLNTEIISADSRQIYQHLSVGTAKPLQEELNEVKHHFIDELDPSENYNVSRFENEVFKIIATLSAHYKIPVVVGGSGLYIKAIVDGIIDEVDTDEDYRQQLLYERKNFGNEYLYEKLQSVDPEAASAMLPQNWKRVIRALEVYNLTGKSILHFHKNQNRESGYEFHQYGLKWEREVLYKNIEARVDEMIASGLVNEVKKILSMGYSKEINSLNTVGYKEIIAYLENEITLERAVELIKRNTRRFAKRQLTWFRRDERIKWFDINSVSDIEKIAGKIALKFT